MAESAYPMTHQILIVDDEYAIQSLIQRYFSKRGAKVHCAASGDDMHRVLQQHPVNMVFLDVHLPGKDGFALLDEIRSTYGYEIGVIMLTSRGELDDRIAGLEGGADDYVPKPFEMGELLARSRAVLRRLGEVNRKPGPDTGQYIFAGYCLDVKVRQLYAPDQQRVELSPAEFDLLRVFVRHPQTVLSRDYLLQQTRGRDAAPYDRTIDVRVGQLRKKLPLSQSVMASDEPLFKTVRGGGYMLTQAIVIRQVSEGVAKALHPHPPTPSP